MGIRWIRAGYEGTDSINRGFYRRLYDATDVKFSYGLGSGGILIKRVVDDSKFLHQMGALIAIEGSNEPNNWGILYNGVFSKNGDWTPVAELQRDLYKAVKADPDLNKYPVWGISEAGGQDNNVGLQFSKIPQGANTLMPNGTQFADVLNCHNYIFHQAWPGLHDNQTWRAADPTSDCPVDGIYGNNGKTWAKGFMGYSNEELIKHPRVTTESGCRVNPASGITEIRHAHLIVNMYLSQYKRGWSHTALYLLRDRTDEGGGQEYGLLRPDYSPRPSAVHLHNLTSILGANLTEQPFKLQNFNYKVSAPDMTTVHDLLLQKNDSTYSLIVWGERYVSAAQSVTLQFDSASTSRVSVYDLDAGKEPVRTEEGNVESLTVNLKETAMIFEIIKKSPNKKPWLKIFPNPSNDFVTVMVEDQIKAISVITTDGRIAKIDMATVNEKTKTLITRDLPDGVYFIVVHTASGVVNTKFVKANVR